MDEEGHIVILAAGGSPDIHHKEWGYEDGLCVSSWDIWQGKIAPQRNVLLYDTPGQQAGAGIADYMAVKGTQVEMVTPEVRVADDVGGTTFPILYRRLYAHNIILTPNFWLEGLAQEKR